MNTLTREKHNAYTSFQREDETVRQTEAHALLSCASRMEAARKAEGEMEIYIEAIKHNQQLWTLFQVALCEPDNPLPLDLKITLLNISRYVDKTSFQALTEYKPDSLESLININRTIAAGLAKRTAESAAAAPPPASEPVSVMTSA
ncbi:MAG: flagellar biosynthesis regulator FlaF [Alphaproteobacteria bacterium]|nr:flagellar biosynthesis regulator FlaF [Alphaproteobacteria bacterium]